MPQIQQTDMAICDSGSKEKDREFYQDFHKSLVLAWPKHYQLVYIIPLRAWAPFLAPEDLSKPPQDQLLGFFFDLLVLPVSSNPSWNNYDILED